MALSCLTTVFVVQSIPLTLQQEENLQEFCCLCNDTEEADYKLQWRVRSSVLSICWRYSRIRHVKSYMNMSSYVVWYKVCLKATSSSIPLQLQ